MQERVVVAQCAGDARGGCAQGMRAGKVTEEDWTMTGESGEGGGVLASERTASVVLLDIQIRLRCLLGLHARPCLRDLGMLGEQFTPLACNCF